MRKQVTAIIPAGLKSLLLVPPTRRTSGISVGTHPLPSPQRPGLTAMSIWRCEVKGVGLYSSACPANGSRTAVRLHAITAARGTFCLVG